MAETAAELSGRSRAAVLDVVERGALKDLVESAGGRIDILVNCAGGVAGQEGRPLEEVSSEDWQALFDINVSGVSGRSALCCSKRDCNSDCSLFRCRARSTSRSDCWKAR